MEEEILITNTIINIFNGSDKRNWELVRECFQFEVFVDYFSMSKIPGAKVKADEMIKGWSDFLPRFTFTHHMITNFEVSVNGATATAFCKGHALHYLSCTEGGDTWAVFGTYDFKLAKIASAWKVNSMTFNLLYEDGNKALPALSKQDQNQITAP